MQKLKSFYPLIMLMSTIPLFAQENTNDFYDNSETHLLPGNTLIQVTGEVKQRGTIDLLTLPLRSVIVKEARLAGDSNEFTGAYRYDGYSLYDILNGFLPDKYNQAEFQPIIDLYVTIENATGERVLFSWGEIYYPIHRHEIIIATKVSRIVPSKTGELWPLPAEMRLVAAHDLLTERNISSPVSIIVHSSPLPFRVNRDLKPLYAPEIGVYRQDMLLDKIEVPDPALTAMEYESIFYGKGRGIHSTTPFSGTMLKDVLRPVLAMNRDLLRTGLLVVSAADGYRAVYSCSEVFNRNDQAEVLLIYDKNNQDGGVFRLFPSADFFSDRAVKAVDGIWLIRAE